MSFCVVLVCVVGVVLAGPTPPQPESEPVHPPATTQPVLDQPDLDSLHLESLSEDEEGEESKPVVIVTAIPVDSREAPTTETQPDLQSEPQLESGIDLQSEVSSEVYGPVDVESLYPETLKIITPSTPSADLLQSTLPSPTSSIPETDAPVVNKPIFKRIATSVSSSPAPPSLDSPHDASFRASPIESDVFGAKFFQPAVVEPSSDKSILDKSAFEKFKPSSLKPTLLKPIFVSKNASPKTTTFWPATEKTETSQPAAPQSTPLLPVIPQFDLLQPATSQPAPLQPSLLQPDTSHSTHPQPTPPQPSHPHPALPNSSPLDVQPHLTHHQPSPSQPAPPSSSQLIVQPLISLHQFSAQPALPNSSPFSVQLHSTYPKTLPHSSPLFVQPHPPKPYIPNPSTSYHSSAGGRQVDSISSNLVLSGFGNVKPVQHLHPSPVQSQPIFQPQQSINTQPKRDSDSALGFMVSLGPLTLLTSPSKPSPSLVSVHASPPSISKVEEKEGRSSDAPSLSVASSKQHFSRSHSIEQLHPVFKTQPRHITEEGDESRSISFSVNPPKTAPKLTSNIATKSRGTPAKITYDLPRATTERQETDEQSDKEDRQEEEGRSIPQPKNVPLYFGQPRVTADARTARRVHSPASPHPVTPQERAVPHRPPHGAYHAQHPAQYEFSYRVQGGDSGSHFGHTESRAGPETRGSYIVPLPDGRIQRVTYYVSGDSGYMADVTYEGQAVYPQHKPTYYRENPTHHIPAPSPPRQPIRTYRSEPVQPASAHKSKPVQSAVPQQYASESQVKPVIQPLESPRTYRSVPQYPTSYVSSSMYRIDVPHNLASWPAV